jgi:hypothetical protein
VNEDHDMTRLDTYDSLDSELHRDVRCSPLSLHIRMSQVYVFMGGVVHDQRASCVRVAMPGVNS